MRPREASEQPRTFIAATMLLMLLSVASMLTAGFALNFTSPVPPHQGPPPAASQPVRTSQGIRVQALRAHVTQWVTYLSNWK